MIAALNTIIVAPLFLVTGGPSLGGLTRAKGGLAALQLEVIKQGLFLILQTFRVGVLHRA